MRRRRRSEDPGWPSDPGSRIWILDGHNAIGAHSCLQRLHGVDRQRARLKLAAIVQRFARKHGVTDLTLVFDSTLSLRSPDVARFDPVRIRFSPPTEEKADDEIVRVCADMADRRSRVCVVTRDGKLKGRLPAGVTTVSPEAFFEDVGFQDDAESDTDDGSSEDWERDMERIRQADRERREFQARHRPVRPTEPAPPERASNALERKRARGQRKQRARIKFQNRRRRGSS